MPNNLTTKLIRDHLLGGRMTPGHEIALAVDQTLLQDVLGTHPARTALRADGLEADLTGLRLASR